MSENTTVEKTSLEESKAKGSSKSFSKSKKGKRFSRGRKDKPLKGGNDFAFWNEYPDLMNIAANYPIMHVAGTRLEGNYVSVAIPNVAVQHYLPIPGVQISAVSPLNLAFRNLYLDMHRRYRGIGTYQASDIAITILCIEGVLQMIIEAERVYGILNAYPVKSRIQPEGLLRAMGYSPTFVADVKSNMADFRYSINRLIRLAQRLPLPAGMSFFLNHAALNAFIYKDSEDERAGLISFISDGFFVYRTTLDSDCINGSGTACLETFRRSTFTSAATLISYIEQRLNVLLYDSDILRITSDFIACYGESNMQTILPLDESFTVVPLYSESILRKWHNSERVGDWANDTVVGYAAKSISTTALSLSGFPYFYVYQEGDVVYSMPILYEDNSASWEGTSTPLNFYQAPMGTSVQGDVNGHVVDSWEPDPSIEVKCESVLWKVDTDPHANSGNTKKCLALSNICTEFITQLEVFSVVNGSTVNVFDYSSSDSTVNVSTVDSALIHFDWHPYVFYYNASRVITSIYGDTDNVSTVEEETIAKIVDAALLSAFKVKISPSGGSSNL